MNERIKELAEQAFDKANNGTISDIKIPKEFIEKFAELIVRECLDQLHVNDLDEDYDKGAYWSREQIKNHFGVE
jgi:FKBP-type peptidyl-prolyl cis-trans isomerase (trigger factor)